MKIAVSIHVNADLQSSYFHSISSSRISVCLFVFMHLFVWLVYTLNSQSFFEHINILWLFENACLFYVYLGCIYNLYTIYIIASSNIVYIVSLNFYNIIIYFDMLGYFCFNTEHYI